MNKNHRLSIVIPALNEENSIESIIQRCLTAKEEIIKNSDVSTVEVIVVSDGSTDGTVERANKFKEHITLIIFEKNKGYGAAIKEGWVNATGNLLGFLDADGTCDPNFFVELCNLITRDNADVALGCRLNENSKMPFVRKIGNKFFSIILSFLSSTSVRDTASGMRVIKKESLSYLLPLPDGLHFTPAMSARAIMSDDIKIMEKDMPYHEREGESKLHIWKDGMRFLSVILNSAFLYKPNKLIDFFSFISFLISITTISTPLVYYFNNSAIEDWMIYRLIIFSLFGNLSILLLCVSFLTKKIVRITLNKDINKPIKKTKLYDRFFSSSIMLILSLLLFIIALLLVSNSLSERLVTGHTQEHWSRYLIFYFLTINSFILLTTFIINHFLEVVLDRLIYLKKIK